MFTYSKLILIGLQIFNAFWRYFVSAKDRALGRAEATKEALEIQARENAKAVESWNETSHKHGQHPDSDDAFDPEFKRKD